MADEVRKLHPDVMDDLIYDVELIRSKFGSRLLNFHLLVELRADEETTQVTRYANWKGGDMTVELFKAAIVAGAAGTGIVRENAELIVPADGGEPASEED